MREINSTFATEKNKASNKPIYLYTVYNYDGLNNDLHYAEWTEDITYDSILYTRFPITHDFVGDNSQGTIDSIKISVSNISRLIQAYLELYDFRGKKVGIKIVWANQLADTDAYMEDFFYVDTITATEDVAEFTLSSKFDILDLTLPSRRYSRNYCSWKFRGTECGYDNGESSCNKTFQRCGELGNKLRFGGFPSIPSRAIYVG